MRNSNQGTQGRRGESLSQSIIKAVAAQKGVRVDKLDPLFYVIDPEALDDLFAPRKDGTPRTDGRVRFTYAGYEVEVSSDGRVWLDIAESKA